MLHVGAKVDFGGKEKDHSEPNNSYVKMKHGDKTFLHALGHKSYGNMMMEVGGGRALEVPLVGDRAMSVEGEDGDFESVRQPGVEREADRTKYIRVVDVVTRKQS